MWICVLSGMTTNADFFVKCIRFFRLYFTVRDCFWNAKSPKVVERFALFTEPLFARVIVLMPRGLGSALDVVFWLTCLWRKWSVKWSPFWFFTTFCSCKTVLTGLHTNNEISVFQRYVSFFVLELISYQYLNGVAFIKLLLGTYLCGSLSRVLEPVYFKILSHLLDYLLVCRLGRLHSQLRSDKRYCTADDCRTVSVVYVL